jgi:hypothetical protein
VGGKGGGENGGAEGVGDRGGTVNRRKGGERRRR